MKKIISAVMSLAVTSSLMLGNFSEAGVKFSALALHTETLSTVNVKEGDVAIGFSREGWKDSYKQVLAYYKNLNGAKFDLIYLNDDEIPELVINDPACRLIDFNAPDEYRDTKYGMQLFSIEPTEAGTTLLMSLEFRTAAVTSVSYLKQEGYCKFSGDAVLYHLEEKDNITSLNFIGDVTEEEKQLQSYFDNADVVATYIQHDLIEESIEDVLAGEPAIQPSKCGENAFWSLDEATGTLTISGSGELYDYGDWAYDGITPPWCVPESYGSNIKSVVIEEGITSIGEMCFFGDALTSVKLPESLTKIGAFAFHDCMNLKEITIPENVSEIGDAAFGQYGNGGSGVVKGFTVYGYTGSAAEKYVSDVNSYPDMENHITFSALNNQDFDAPSIVKAVIAGENTWLTEFDDMTISGRNDCWFQDMDMDGEPEFIVGGLEAGAHASKVFKVYKEINGVLTEVRNITDFDNEDTTLSFWNHDKSLPEGYGGFRCQLFRDKTTGKFIYVYPMVDGVASEEDYFLEEFRLVNDTAFIESEKLTITENQNGFFCTVDGNRVKENALVKAYYSYFSNFTPYQTTVKLIPCTASSAEQAEYYDNLSYDEKIDALTKSYQAWAYQETDSVELPLADIIRKLSDAVPEGGDAFTKSHYDFMNTVSAGYWYNDYSNKEVMKDVLNIMNFDLRYGELARSYSKHITSDALSLSSDLFQDLRESQDIANLTSKDIYAFVLSEIITEGYSEINITENVKNELQNYLAFIESSEEKMNALDLVDTQYIVEELMPCTTLKELIHVFEGNETLWKFLTNEFDSKFSMISETSDYKTKYAALVYLAFNQASGNLSQVLGELLASESVQKNAELREVVQTYKDAIDAEDISEFIEEKSAEIISDAKKEAIEKVNADLCSEMISKGVEKIAEKLAGQFIFEWKMVQAAGEVIGIEAAFIDKIEKIDDVKFYIGSFYSCNELHQALFKEIERLNAKTESYNNASKMHTLLQLYRYTDINGVYYAKKYINQFYNNNAAVNVAAIGRVTEHVANAMFNPFDTSTGEKFTQLTGYQNMKKAYNSVIYELKVYKDRLYDTETECCSKAQIEEKDPVALLLGTPTKKWGDFQEVTIACPVEVTVYRNEKQIATLNDSGVSISNEEYRVLFNVIDEVDDDGNLLDTKAKIIRIDETQGFSYHITALDDGDFTVLSYPILADGALGSAKYEFEEVPLAKGNEYEVSKTENSYILKNNTSGETLQSFDLNYTDSSSSITEKNTNTNINANNSYTPSNVNNVTVESSPFTVDSFPKAVAALAAVAGSLMVMLKKRKKND